MHYARIASRLYNTPLLITPEAGDAVSMFLKTRIGGVDIAPGLLDTGADQAVQYSAAKGRKPYSVQDGIGIIQVSGELVNRGAWIGAQSGLTSYEGIIAQLKAAGADASVNGIMMIMDTPGGEAAGVSDVSAAMKAAGKPVWVLANTIMASGGYWLGAGADKIGAVKDARIGSIGVVWMHADRSGELAAKGINVTVVQVGAKKTQFSQLNALSPEAKKQAEGIILDIYNEFVAHAAAGRGLSLDAVKATEADIFTAKEAKKIGLIDAIVTQDQFHLAMVAAMRKGKPMGAPSGKPAGNSSVSAILKPTSTLKGPTMSGEFIHTAEDLAQAKAEAIAAGREAGVQAGKADALKVGAAAERERISAIMNSDEAKGRGKLATHLALSTDTSIDAAKSILSMSAEEPAAAAVSDSLKPPKNLLDAAMGKGENANADVGADVGGKVDSGNGKALTAAEKAADIRARAEAQHGKPQAGIR
jgi:signal peptide peptidase SppA